MTKKPPSPLFLALPNEVQEELRKHFSEMGKKRSKNMSRSDRRKGGITSYRANVMRILKKRGCPVPKELIEISDVQALELAREKYRERIRKAEEERNALLNPDQFCLK